MQAFKKITISFLTLFFMLSFFRCVGSHGFQKSPPFTISEVYFQSWGDSINGTDSGIEIYVPIKSNPSNIVLDSIYFKGKWAKLEPNNYSLFVGRFKTVFNSKKDIVMSNKPYAEYGNQIPDFSKEPSFELKDDECILSYKMNSITKYFKYKG